MLYLQQQKIKAVYKWSGMLSLKYNKFSYKRFSPIISRFQIELCALFYLE